MKRFPSAAERSSIEPSSTRWDWNHDAFRRFVDSSQAESWMKHVLGLREGATENATVVRELLEDLAQRGVDFTRARLYVLDGAKALHAAVKKVAGASALIQRCQLHKKRNVRDHLPKQYQASVWRQMCAAYAMRD